MDLKRIPPKKQIICFAVAFVIVLLAATVLMWSNVAKCGDPVPPKFPAVYFEGEYRIGDGEWQQVVDGKHIPATKGDVTLRGTFHMFFEEENEYLGYAEEGIPIAFYMNHIGITVYEDGQEPYQMDNENPIYGVSGCGKQWIGYSLRNDGAIPVELLIHNPHKFGNDIAVDQLLDNLSVWVSSDFDRQILSEGNLQRSGAMVSIIISLIFFGAALVSSFLRIKNSVHIWLIGFSVLAAGGYILYTSRGVSFWSESVTVNTTMLCICTMFYMLFVSILATCLLDKTRHVGVVTSALLGIADIVIFLLPLFLDVYIYDMIWIWAVAQGVIGAVICGALIFEVIRYKGEETVFRSELAFIFLAFAIDIAGNLIGVWNGGAVSLVAFAGAILFSLIFVLRIVPKNIAMLSKAKETELQRVKLEAEKNAIEAELQESRISIMLSQIQPHFLYNTLNSIYQLCETNPMLARSMVNYFSEYLRNNLSSIDDPGLIAFETELSHINTYLEIEKIRFDDTLEIEYDVSCVDFKLPVLTVQPLVENAVKHGTSKKRGGGKVVISTFEDESSFVITVSDTGRGFDPTKDMNDGRRHIGIENIRQRLSNMCGGVLTIESEIGVGTVATVRIPKEVNNEDHSSRRRKDYA